MVWPRRAVGWVMARVRARKGLASSRAWFWAHLLCVEMAAGAVSNETMTANAPRRRRHSQVTQLAHAACAGARQRTKNGTGAKRNVHVAPLTCSREQMGIYSRLGAKVGRLAPYLLNSVRTPVFVNKLSTADCGHG